MKHLYLKKKKKTKKVIINKDTEGDNNINNEKEFLDIKEQKLKGETKLRGKKKLKLKNIFKKENNNNAINEIKEEEKIDLINLDEYNNINNDNNNINIPEGTEEDINTNLSPKEEEEVDYTKKEGYEDMLRLREKFMSNKIEVDEDHLYIPKAIDTNRLRGKKKTI